MTEQASNRSNRMVMPEPNDDSLLPLQFFLPRRPQTPERQLMAAVLLDALSCIDKYRYAQTPQGRSLHDEAQDWFASMDTQWPYSFERVCDVLDIDAGAVRLRLRQVAAGSGHPTRRFRSRRAA